MDESRRTVLKTGGAVLAGVTSIAGCLGVGGETATDRPKADNDGSGDGVGSGAGDGDGDGDAVSGGTESGGETDTESGTATATPVASRPETPASKVTRWMPDPKLLDQTDSSGYAFLSMAPKALGEFADDIGSDALSDFDREYPISGVGKLGDLTLISRFARSVSVLVGEFERTEVEDGLREYGFEAGDSRNGFRLFSASDPRAVALRDGMLVSAGSVSSSDSTDKLSVVEHVVDARTGQSTQYVDAIEDCSRLFDGVGSAHVLQGRTHGTGKTFEHGVGEGMGYHVGSEETRVHAAALFADGEANRSAMSDWASDSEAFLGGEPTVRTDRRVVTATALVPTGDVTEFPGEFPGPEIESERVGPPTAKFSFEFRSSDDSTGVVRITHDGGDSIERESLAIRGTGFASVEGVDQTSEGTWQGSASGDEDTVVAGDAVTVGAASDYEISLVWQSAGDSSATLATHEGPDA